MGSCGSKDPNNPKHKSWHIQTCEAHEGGINCMAISEDGSVLATGSEDYTARVWSTKTDIVQCIGILSGHDDYINCILIEENYVVTGSADKTVRKWDMTTCDCTQVFQGHTSLVNRIICTGDFIFSSSYDRTARCWDFDTGECIRVFSGHKKGVYPLIFIPADEDDVTPENFDWEGNKDILISGSADSTARSWSFETGKTIYTFRGHKAAITCMSTDPGGKILFTGSADQSVRSWDIIKGDSIKVFDGHQAAVICLTVVNKIMYTGSSDQTGRSWVTEFGDCTRIYRGHKHTVSCLKFVDGLLITGCGDGIIRCFDAKSGGIKRQLKGHEKGINCMQVGISNGRLFTGSHDGTLRVWDVTGMKDDVTFGREPEEKEKKEEKPAQNGQTKIMIEDEYTKETMNGVGNGTTNGDANHSIDLNGSARFKKDGDEKVEQDMMDMV